MTANETTVRIKWEEAMVDAEAGTVTVPVEPSDPRVRSHFLRIAIGRNVLVRGERWGPIAWAGSHISVSQVEQGAEQALKDELEVMLAQAKERARRKQSAHDQGAARRLSGLDAASREMQNRFRSFGAS